MRVLLYRGKGLISRLIRWQTRSAYSHAAVELRSGRVVEAWHIGGVRVIDSPFDGHASGTEIDRYAIGADYSDPTVEAYLLQQVGMDYDFLSVARFLSRRDAPANDRWFCSELVVAAFRRAGVSLVRGEPSHLSPRDLALSPYLIYEGTLR